MPTPQNKPATQAKPDQLSADERAELEKFRAERDQTAKGKAAEKDEPPEPTHVQVLANGDTVETASPVATAHAGKDGKTWPVVSTYELPREEA